MDNFYSPLRIRSPIWVILRGVKPDVDAKTGRGRLYPQGTFVIQLRSDSDLPRGRVRGRVEHVKSGDSEPFTSIESLVAFMARYAAAGPPTSKKPERPEGEQR